MAILCFFYMGNCAHCKKKNVECVYLEEDYEDKIIYLCKECFGEAFKKTNYVIKQCDHGNCCLRQPEDEWFVKEDLTECIHISKNFDYYLCKKCVKEKVEKVNKHKFDGKSLSPAEYEGPWGGF
ncbi:MAG: hypothetical protein GY853_14160 [PVC group bacterium]|nr:hypothetical protein [PVC group bacterium]